MPGRLHSTVMNFSNPEAPNKSAGHHHHYLMKKLLGDISFAPPPPSTSSSSSNNKNDYKVLDVCTGSADWAVDFAQTHNLTSHVTAFDVYLPTPSPSPSSLSRELPQNLTLEIEDVNRPGGLKYTDASFDHIFARRLGLEVRDWDSLLKDLVRILKPGGVLEVWELDPLPRWYKPELKPADSDLWVACTEAIAGTLALQGVDVRSACALDGKLKGLGLEVERERVVELPMCEWHSDPLMKEIGTMQFATLSKVYDEFNLTVYTRTMGLPYAEAMSISDVHKSAVEREAKAAQGFNNLYIYVARKPGAST